ncbi:MAG: FAD-binding oxidoreductase [Candidatus Promineifilaceae bacterium]
MHEGAQPIGAGLSIPELRAAFDGEVIAHGDPGYDEARTVFLGGIDRRPALIVRVAGAADVARVIGLARESGLELAVRSGGHSVTDGGIVLDLAAMKALEIDPESRTAWAEAGLTAAEYTSAAAAHGLATGFGDTGSVGIGGITLGGGVGFLARKFGLTIDDLLAAEVVTADGQLLHVDGRSHPDLFWAIRGGGGNFGVATRFQYRLHELPEIVGGMLFLPATAEVIEGFIAAAEAAPDELTTIANIMTAPPLPFLPAEQHGKLIILAMMTYAGPAEAGEHALAPFRALATPLADMLRPMSYPEMYMPDEEEYHPVAAARSLFMDSVDRRVAETIIERLQAATGYMAVAQLRVLGGAVARTPAGATAYAHRGRRIMANVAALYEDLEEKAAHEAWAEEFAAALRQGEPGVYVNFLADEGQARVREAYPGATWERLAAVKRRYDPANLFRLNQNVRPAQVDEKGRE